MLNLKFSSLYPMDMGERIKYAREHAGLSQAEFARKVGVSKGAPSQWEHGNTKNLRMANLFATEDATGFCARWIALGEGPERLPVPASPSLSPEDFDKEARDFSNEELAALFQLAADQLSR